jgi:hypothetical protein
MGFSVPIQINPDELFELFAFLGDGAAYGFYLPGGEDRAEGGFPPAPIFTVMTK